MPTPHPLPSHCACHTGGSEWPAEPQHEANGGAGCELWAPQQGLQSKTADLTAVAPHQGPSRDAGGKAGSHPTAPKLLANKRVFSATCEAMVRKLFSLGKNTLMNIYLTRKT